MGVEQKEEHKPGAEGAGQADGLLRGGENPGVLRDKEVKVQEKENILEL